MTFHPPPPPTDANGNNNASFEASLREAAALDAPPKNLHHRILTELERKKRLDAFVVPKRRSHPWLWPATTGFACAAAAAFGLFFWRSIAVPARPELTGVAARATASTAAPGLGPKPLPRDPCVQGNHATGHSPLIDDFEDGDDTILTSEQRTGFWRWNRDTDKPWAAPALLPTERPSPSRTNRNALHVKGAQLRDWGAAIEMTFDSFCYDASAYVGLTFSARGPGRIYVSPREVGVIPPNFGGTCENDCYNGHTRKIDLSSNFKTYEVRWSEVAQRGYGRPRFDPKRLHDITFLIHPEDTPYDIWLDDLRFLKE